MTLIVFLLVLSAAFAHALWNFIVKRATDRAPVLWLGLWVTNLALIPVSALLVLRDGFSARALPSILASGVAHAFYFVTLMRSYVDSDISSAYPIARGLGVGGTALAALLLLRERVTPAGGAGILLVCAGVLLIGLAGQAGRTRLQAAAWPLLTGLCIITYSVVDKLGVDAAHPLVYINTLQTLALALQTPFVLRRYGGSLRGIWRAQWKNSLLIGLGSTGTYLLILFAFRLERAAYIVAVREFSVVIAALLGVLLLRERLGPGKAAGILAIAAGLVFIRLG